MKKSFNSIKIKEKIKFYLIKNNNIKIQFLVLYLIN